MPRKIFPFSIFKPSEQERAQIHGLSRRLVPSMKLVDASGKSFELPGVLFDLLKQGAEQLANGQSIYQDSLNRFLSSQEAAELLSISRTHLVKLLEQNELPFTMVGAHRRLRLVDVLEYKKHMQTQSGLSRQDVERFQALIERARAITYILALDPSPTPLYFSPQIEHLSGFSAEELLRSPELLLERTFPPDLSNLREQVRNNAENQAPFVMEYRIVTRDGHIRWIHNEAIVVKDEPGARRLMEGFLLDVTDRIEAGQALRQSEEIFRSIVEHSADGIALTDETGRIIEWNQSQTDLTGIRREEAIGQCLWDLQFRLAAEKTPERYTHNKAAIEHVLQSGKAPFTEKSHEAVLLNPSGRRRKVETRNFVVQTSRGNMLGGIMREVSQRMLGLEALAATRDEYLGILDGLPVLIWRAGKDAKCNYVNQAWLEHTGRSKEEELGDGWLTGVHPEDLDRVIGTYLKAFHFQQPFDMEYRLRHRDGDYRRFRDRGRPFQGADCEYAGYLGFCVEIED